MKFIDEYRDVETGKKLLERIRRLSTRPTKLMEFCGGHTVAIMKNGLRQLLPKNIEMLSGPGCPVCVSANADIDHLIALSSLPDVILTSFGDMIKVPGSFSSLQKARSEGADIRVVYSVQDAIQIAGANLDKSVIFAGVGFETTAPAIGSAILEAQAKKIKNFYVLSMLKLCPPAMKAVLDLGELRLDGIVGPGHVSTIMGTGQYEFIPRDYGIAFVVSGFETLDILYAIERLVEQIETGKPEVEIGYRRGVKDSGNKTALGIMHRVFEVSSVEWRGLGEIPLSGLKIRNEFARFDAAQCFEVELLPAEEVRGCICGEILRGIKTPENCPLFRKACSPENPIGPCMVSSEGACSAYYAYGPENE